MAPRNVLPGLGLALGDELKYVYDFGDWIEHRITLEAITEPQPDVKYPRVLGQNKPQYQDCETLRCARAADAGNLDLSSLFR